MQKTVVCNNLNETEKLANSFALAIPDTGCFVCLFGDIGAGKTAFVKLVAKHLGVTEKVTSPSFVILNEYRSGRIPIIHFDLYRLENEGVKTVIEELTEYSKLNYLTFAEWAEFSQGEIPDNRIDINIEYIDETIRSFTFTAHGEASKNILEKIN